MNEKRTENETKKPLSLKGLKTEMDTRLGALQGDIGKVLSLLEAQSAPEVGSMHREEVVIEEPPEKKAEGSYKFMFKARMFKSHGTGREQPSRMRQVLQESKRIEINPITHEYKITEPIVADFGEEGPGPPGFWGTDNEDLAKLMRDRIAQKRRDLKLKPEDPVDIEEIDVSSS